MVVYRGNHQPPESQEARSVRQPRCAWESSHPRGPKTTSSGQSSVPRNETRRTKKCHLCHLWNKTGGFLLVDLMVDFEGSCASKSYIYIYLILITYLYYIYLPTVTRLAFFGNVATYSSIVSIVTSIFSEALARSLLRPGDMQRHGEHIKELLINKPRLASLPDKILQFAT